MSRRAREGEVVCRCSAYTHPHRQFGGRCTLGRWVSRFFDLGKKECRQCMNFDTQYGECQCDSGQEEPAHCPELRDFIRYESIAVYGSAAKALGRIDRSSQPIRKGKTKWQKQKKCPQY